MYKTIEEFLNGNFKEDYSKANPEDYQLNEIKNVTYKEILTRMLKEYNSGLDIYDIIGDVDSAIRENLFCILEENTGLDYDDFYNYWLRGEKSIALKNFENKYLK